jgi:hypothetical protein
MKREMSCEGKIVPWTQLENYLVIHQRALLTFVDLHKQDLMEVPDIESKLPKSFLQLHDAITTILRDN